MLGSARSVSLKKVYNSIIPYGLAKLSLMTLQLCMDFSRSTIFNKIGLPKIGKMLHDIIREWGKEWFSDFGHHSLPISPTHAEMHPANSRKEPSIDIHCQNCLFSLRHGNKGALAPPHPRISLNLFTNQAEISFHSIFIFSYWYSSE